METDTLGDLGYTCAFELPLPPATRTRPMNGYEASWPATATATATRQLLAREPTGPTLIEDLDQDHYYRQV